MTRAWPGLSLAPARRYHPYSPARPADEGARPGGAPNRLRSLRGWRPGVRGAIAVGAAVHPARRARDVGAQTGRGRVEDLLGDPYPGGQHRSRVRTGDVEEQADEE